MTFIKSLSSLGWIWADSLLLRDSTQLITSPCVQFNTADGADGSAAPQPAHTTASSTILPPVPPCLPPMPFL